MAEGQTLSHRWMRVLDALRPDARRFLLHRLEEDYREELVAAERLTADARGVRAAHLRHKLDDISEAEREHARSLREAIVGLGGVLPGPTEPPAGPRPARTFLRLLEDLEAEKNASADYQRTAGVARRAGETGVEALLARIRADEERHARELVDILERLDPNA